MARPETYIGLTLLGIAAFYVALLPFDIGPRDDSATVPGWDKLEACANLVSFDGTRSIELHADHTIELTDDDESDDTKKGAWSLKDADQSAFELNIDDVATTYTIVSPSGSEGCMLVPGLDTQHVNIQDAWFSATDDD